MLSVRCRNCGRELVAHPTKTRCCGCSNMTTVKEDSVTAVNLADVILLNTNKSIKKSSVLTPDDLKYQEARRQRRVRKLDFEER